MELKEAILNRRTRRKFTDKKVEHHKLEQLIEFARYTPTGQNLQPLKYYIVDDEETVKKIFPHTKWSGYHPEDAPTERERPTAYIAILGDCSIKPSGEFGVDAGAAGTIITLAAEDIGLASCWIGSVDKKEVSELLGLADNFKLLYVIAVGYSNQLSKAVDANGDIKYFMDNDVLTVPKRTREEILISGISEFYKDEMYNKNIYTPSNKKINAVVEYINDNIKDKISLDVIAEKFYISKYHLCHSFKNTTGHTIHNYINMQKTEVAKEMLNAGMPPSEVAFECGFTDYSVFYKAFKKYTGKTPTQHIGNSRVSD